MQKMRIGDVIKIIPNGVNSVWEWNNKLKVKVGEEFDPLRAVKVYGCKGKPCEVSVVEDAKKRKNKGAK